MYKKAGIIIVTAGAVLILSALLLFLRNVWEDQRTGQKADLLLEDIRTVIGEPAADPQPDAASDPNEPGGEEDAPLLAIPEDLPTVSIDGYDYIGYLSIPDLGLELPVMSDWDYDRLAIAPCRQFGSSRTDDLVIAAHNYKNHFGRLSSLKGGAEITFTDMTGEENRYIVSRVENISKFDVDAVCGTEYDLVLYTCTPGGKMRVAVFCDRVVGMRSATQ